MNTFLNLAKGLNQQIQKPNQTGLTPSKFHARLYSTQTSELCIRRKQHSKSSLIERITNRKQQIKWQQISHMKPRKANSESYISQQYPLRMKGTLKKKKKEWMKGHEDVFKWETKTFVTRKTYPRRVKESVKKKGNVKGRNLGVLGRKNKQWNAWK